MIISKSKIKAWMVWVAILGVFGYSCLHLLHSALTVDRFEKEAARWRGSDDPPLIMADQEMHLLWFVQLSDIHISKFWDPGRQTDLRRFCLDWLPVIRPKVVLATGDLTDAKTANFVGSEQYVEEWENYYGAIADSPGRFVRVEALLKW